MTKALLVSTKYPYPTDDGKKAVLAGFLDYLTDRLGSDNVVYVVVGRNPRHGPERAECRTVWLSPPGRLTQLWNALRSLCGLDRKSLQEALTYAPRVERELVEFVDATGPDVVLLDTIRMGQYFWERRQPNGRWVLFMDDLFYLRFRRMVNAATTDAEIRFEPAGTFAPSLPAIARRLLQISFVQNFLYRLESSKSERREVESTGKFDRCLLVNPNEARVLQARCPNAPVLPVKPLLRTGDAVPPRNFDGTPRFLLFGSLRHPVYRASVLKFLQRPIEDALRCMPSADIVIVGEGADDEIRAQCARFDGRISIHGFVSDIDALFTTACALLIPLIAPGGLKLKTLTALYYGLPIVATDSGVDGIPLRDGFDFIRENDLGGFAPHMARLTDLSLNREISRNAARAFQQHYSKERVYAEYDEIFGLASS